MSMPAGQESQSGGASSAEAQQQQSGSVERRVWRAAKPGSIKDRQLSARAATQQPMGEAGVDPRAVPGSSTQDSPLRPGRRLERIGRMGGSGRAAGVVLRPLFQQTFNLRKLAICVSLAEKTNDWAARK